MLCNGGPTTVLRRVRAVIVYAIKACAFWARADIVDKVRHIMPTVANVNTSTAVSSVFSGVWFIAPRHHRMPRWVQGVIPKTVFTVDFRRFSDAVKLIFNDCRVAVFVPSQIMLATEAPRKKWVSTIGLGTGAHAESIA